MIELPKKYKKEIIVLTTRYYELAKPKKILVSIRKTIPVEICWCEDNHVDINDQAYDESYYSYYEAKEIQRYNREIRRFIKDTEIFGKKYFRNADWIWQNVLWNFRPENGEMFDFKKVRWVNDYYE